MKKWILGGLVALTMAGCGGDGGHGSKPGAGTTRTLLLLLGTDVIGRVSTSAPTTITNVKAVTGLRAGENLVSLDRRPSTGQIYAITNLGAFYVLNPDSGAATLVGSGNFGATISGSVTDIDFDPVNDVIRVATSQSQNFRVSPTTGAVIATDATFQFDNGATASVPGLAYVGSTLYATSQYLQIVKIAPPNSGTVEFYATEHPFDDDAQDYRAFDVSSDGKVAIIGLYDGDNTFPRLVRVDLATGEPTDLGRLTAPVLASLTFLEDASPM